MGKPGDSSLPNGEVQKGQKFWQHAKGMQIRRAMLVRTLKSDGNEDLQICSVWLSQDAERLCWEPVDNDGIAGELPMSAVSEVSEEAQEIDSEADGEHFALRLTLRKATGGKAALGLICAHREDFVVWRDGFRFLLTPDSVASTVGRESGQTQPAPSSSSKSDGAVAQTLRLQEDLIAQLRHENDLLRETLKRKDAMIAQLLQDAQNQASPGDRCNKTESTSRESDEHLRDREMTILRRKNAKLQKALRAKQQTVSELLQLVKSLTQQQGAETEPEEGASEDEDDEEEDKRAVPSTPAEGSAAARSSSGLPSASAAPATSSGNRAPQGEEVQGQEADNDDAQAMVRALIGMLSGSQLTAPDRPGSGGAGTSVAHPKAQAASLSREGERRIPGGGGAAAMAAQRGQSTGSAAALRVLAQELETLEEKKRVVEKLAKQLEPPSDNEEDDGFPLR